MSTSARLVLVTLLLASSPVFGFGDTPLSDGYILAAANAAGGHGTYWKTDVWVHNAGPDVADVAFWFLPSGKPGRTESSAEIRVSPGETVEIPNILGTLLRATDPVGAIEFRVVSGPPLFVQSRTSAVRDGAVPVPASSLTEAASSSEPTILENLRRGVVFRTNLSVVNPLPRGAEATLELRDAEGRLVSTQRIALEPLSYLALGDLLAPLGRARNASVTLLPEGEARLLALASIVSSETGEVETVEATPLRGR